MEDANMCIQEMTLNIGKKMIKGNKDINMNLIREATLPEIKTNIIEIIKRAKSKEELKFILINLKEDIILRESGGKR
jgi:hypothetical protein